MENTIFGYSWEDIQAMQMKTFVRKTIATCDCCATNCQCGGQCTKIATVTESSGAKYCADCA